MPNLAWDQTWDQTRKVPDQMQNKTCLNWLGLELQHNTERSMHASLQTWHIDIMVMCLQTKTICRHQSLQLKYCIFSFSKSFLAYQFLLHVLHQILQSSLLASATLSAWCLCALQWRHSWLASARQWLNLSFGTHSQPHLECGCHVALHLRRMLACYHAWG